LTVEKDGSKTVKMREVKIKDFDKWSKQKEEDLTKTDSNDDSGQDNFDPERIE
jgi:hypothetical protein